MKLQSLFNLILVMIALHLVHANRCRREIRKCNVTSSNGVFAIETYNGCTHFCCGAAVHDRDVNVDCCGGETAGTLYSTDTQMCCSWPFGKEFQVYEKEDFLPGSFCCGTEVFQPTTLTSHQSCCNGYKNRPQVFNYMTEMCCGGNKAFAGDTAYSSCCGDTSYDRRVASCPCHNGVIGVGIPDAEAACCYSNDRLTSSAYNLRSEGCCNGQGFDVQTQFCCGDQVGEKATQTCCGDEIISWPGEFETAEVACCVTNRGETEVYDPENSVCCQGSVLSKDVEGDVQCCGNALFNIEEFGDQCCGGTTPYKSALDVCCNGTVGEGDSCCSGQPYSSKSFICCNGQIEAHNLVIPSCCHNKSFDAYTETCCGTTVFENPLIPGEQGQLVPSHHTRCCGDHSNDKLLFPYHYLTQTCCYGDIVDIGEVPFYAAQCCGMEVIDTSSHLCCNGNAVENLYNNYGSCCGDSVIDDNSTICCDDVAHSKLNFNNPTCCGSSLMDAAESICCDGVARSLNGVAPDTAICCGDGCIDGKTYWCCNGKQFQKGATNGVAVSGLACSDLFG